MKKQTTGNTPHQKAKPAPSAKKAAGSTEKTAEAKERSSLSGERPAHSSERPADSGEKPTHPITKKDEVQQSNDEHIDQDFPGYPHPPAKTKTIHNGSAGAFEGTESTRDDEDSDEDDDDRAIKDPKY